MRSSTNRAGFAAFAPNMDVRVHSSKYLQLNECATPTVQGPGCGAPAKRISHPSLLHQLGILLTFTVALSLAACTSHHRVDQPTKLALISQQIDSLLLSDPHRHAVSAGIITTDNQYKIHRGTLPTGCAPTDETLYEIASITKTFTGLLLAYAMIEKDLNIDADIRPYWPASAGGIDRNLPPICFRHLATHRSGLPLWFPHKDQWYASEPDWDRLPFELNEMQKGFTREQFFQSLAQFHIETTPGTETLYSNAGTNLLGYLLESIYRRSFDQLLQDKILSPLDMQSTTIRLSHVDPTRLARGTNAHGLPMPPRVEKEMNAEGGIISNLDDMLKYMEHHLTAKSPVTTYAHQRLLDEPDAYHNGLFWRIPPHQGGPRKLVQAGGAYGTSSWITLIPERRTGIFIAVNTSGSDIHERLERTADNILTILKKR